MKKQSKKKATKKAADPKKQELNKSNADIERPFDFGGLPERNLKKNLGC